MRRDQELRFNRIYSDELFLMDAAAPEDDPNLFGTSQAYTFTVSGSTRTVYNVALAKRGTFTCSCPDMDKVLPTQRVCKHICFVLFRVLKHPLAEKARFFGAQCTLTPEQTHSLVEVCMQRRFALNAGVEPANVLTFGAQKAVEVGDECPICYMAFASDAFDASVGVGGMVGCPDCKNNVHKRCMEKWLETRHTCIYCRSGVWRQYYKTRYKT